MTDDTGSIAEAAIASVHAFIEAFNAQDHQALAASLNYPHVRLAGGRFMQIESAEDFVARSSKGKSMLEAEGWHHTEVRSLKVVHCGTDKAHIALTIDRCRADGEVYNQFETLWIATLQDGHWGIQFRSSYLGTSR